MLWLTVRQFRMQALVALVGLAILGLVVLIVGQHVLHDWSSVSDCAKSADCASATTAFESKYADLDEWLDALDPGGPRTDRHLLGCPSRGT